MMWSGDNYYYNNMDYNNECFFGYAVMHIPIYVKLHSKLASLELMGQ